MSARSFFFVVSLCDFLVGDMESSLITTGSSVGLVALLVLSFTHFDVVKRRKRYNVVKVNTVKYSLLAVIHRNTP